MKFRTLSLIGALALSLVRPAFGITVNVSDWLYPPGSNVSLLDTANGINYDGGAGAFSGVYDASGSVPMVGSGTASTLAIVTSAPTSFVAYCAELTQSFSFGVTYTDYGSAQPGARFGARKLADLSRLFTAFGGSVVDAATSAAMQAAIWEVIYETGSSYSLTGGTFTIGTQDAATARAFGRVDALLGSLSNYGTGYDIGLLASPSAQDFLFATAIPEPGTWALYVGGLAAMGLVIRRRRSA